MALYRFCLIAMSALCLIARAEAETSNSGVPAPIILETADVSVPDEPPEPSSEESPPSASRTLAVEAAWWDPVGSNAHMLGYRASLDLYLDSWEVDWFGGMRLQPQFSLSLYAFFPEGVTSTQAGDLRFRLRAEPPLASWLPIIFPQIGAVIINNDSLGGGTPIPTSSVLIGGVLHFPVVGLDSAVIELEGMTNVVGDSLARYSCGVRWFFSKTVGITLHSDNFIRRKQATTYHHRGFAVGVLIR